MATQYVQPTEDQIRTQAYFMWEADGRPIGKDWEYWMKAKQQLERENGSARKSSPIVAEPKKRTGRTAYA